MAERLRALGMTKMPPVVLLRAFKHERVLEVWAGRRGAPLRLVEEVEICAASGVLGPKSARGDLQVPEGLYHIDRLNPFSQFHLSLRVSYPSAADRKRSTAADLGGDIYVHGGCASIGCIAIGDDAIERVYLWVAAAREPVEIHIFPRRLDEAGWRALEADAGASEHLAFWRTLRSAYEAFEGAHRPQVASRGR